MTRKLRSAGMVLVVLVSAVVGGVALGGTAAALDGKVAGTYPLTPGSPDTLGTSIVVVRPGDSVAQNGIKEITLRATSGGSFENVTDDDVFIAVRGGKRIEIAENNTSIVEVSGIDVSKSGSGDRLTITLPRPVRPRFASDSPNTGAEVAVKFDNFSTPSQPGDHTLKGSLTGPSGNTDGPVSIPYTLYSPGLSMSNQSVSQFDDTQTLNVTASIPGGGYVGLYTVGQNGAPQTLIGSKNISTQPAAGNYSIDVSGNVSESQRVMAVAYTESEGRSVTLREEESFNPAQDDRLVTNGTVLNATGYVSTLDVDGRVAAGNEYPQGARLYFSGEPDTSYRIQTVQNGQLGSTATQFQTAANGTAVIDTADFGEGQYAVSRVTDGSLVSLDDDSTTGPQDDSFTVSGQQMTTTPTTTGGTTASGTAATTAGGTQATTSTTTAGEQTATAADSGGGDTETSGSANGGGGSDGSGAFGPGFGVGVAVVALLGAALLAVRRGR